MLAYLGILLIELLAVWSFFQAARRHFNPEKYISSQEKEHSKIIMRLFGLAPDEHRSLHSNRWLGYINLFVALLVWLVFLFHLFFFVTKLTGR